MTRSIEDLPNQGPKSAGVLRSVGTETVGDPEEKALLRAEVEALRLDADAGAATAKEPQRRR